MADPAILINVLNVNDEQRFSLNWRKTKGLFSAALRTKATVRQTMDGPIQFSPATNAFEPRRVLLAGKILAQGSYLKARQTLQDLAEAISTRPARLQVGVLYADGHLNRADDVDSAYALLPDKSTFELEGEFVPGTWNCLYGYAVGAAQGIIVADDRLDRTDYALSGNPVKLTNPGSAPCFASIMISVAGGAASTVLYLRNTRSEAQGKIVMGTTDGSGNLVKYVSQSYGVILMPGENWLRIEVDAGTVATGTVKWGFRGTAFRYLGNDANKMNEGPAVWTAFRRGIGSNATYFTAAGTVANAVEHQPRIGVGNGAWTAAKAGLILEPSTTNELESSEDLSNATYWTNAGGATFGGAVADLPNGGNSKAISGTYTSLQQSVTATNDDWWTFSVFHKKEAVGTAYPALGMLFNGTTDAIAIFDPNAGTAVIASGSATVKVYDAGASWWRVCMSAKSDSAGNTSLLAYYSNASSTNGTTVNPAASGTHTASGAQLENKPSATSYVKTTTTAVTRADDRVCLWKPHNYAKYSRDLTQTSAWVATGLTVARAGTAADGTASCSTVTFSASPGDDTLLQAITPDIRPDAAPWTLVGSFRLGSLTGANNFVLLLQDQAGTDIDTLTIAGNELSASETRSFSKTVSASDAELVAASGLKFGLRGLTGAGTVIVEGLSLQRGTFPGPILMTESAAVPLPASGWDWPTWGTQNLVRTVKAVLPTISTGANYGVFGDSAGWVVGNMKLCLFRPTAATTSQNYLRLVVATNGTQYDSGNIDVGAVWDDATHGYRVTLENYTDSAGTQYMYVLLDVEVTAGSGTYVNKLTSGNLATATTTAFSAGEREWLSDGGTNATLRDWAYSMPTLPAGAVLPALSA